MENRYMLTPYFLHEPVPALAALAQTGWRENGSPWPVGSVTERVVPLCECIADFVAEVARAGQRPVSIAGDCVSTLGVLAGLQRAGVSATLIWFDAHGDFNTWETTPSQFVGGMPLAMIVGRGEMTIVRALGLQPLPESRVWLADARDLDPGERWALKHSAVHHLQQVEALLEQPLPDGPLYVHFDCDVLAPDEAPAVHYPADGGCTAATLQRVFHRLAGTGRVAAVSLSTWAGELDEDGTTQEVVMGVFGELLGEKR
ncbi:MAG: arginase family protein [bacterium]